MASLVPQETIHDLWARAAAQLPDDDKRNINFSRPDKLNILADLHAEAEKAKQRSIETRWKYTRRNGETVILRDLFEKIVRWIDTFKQIGDVAVQYDPAHASLPWAGIRFILQIVVNDSNKFALVLEGLARIAEWICRFAVTEALYLQGTSKAGNELERTVIKLYANILGYLSKAKQYFEQGIIKRIVKSAVISETQLDSNLNDIRTLEDDASRCMVLVDKNDKFHDHAELMDILTRINAPLRRMNDNLKNIHDSLEASKRTKIVQWLSPEPYKQYHNQARQGVLAGTGQWLLSDPIFRQWKDDSASSILWLHGIPGSGKSKLVSIVIEDSIKSFKAGNNPQPVFFYCSRNPAEPERCDPKAILASFARQLSCLEPGKPLLRPAVDLYEKKEREGFASGSLQMDESCTLVSQLIEQYPLTTIVIDAMDECDPQKRRELLRSLEKILCNSSSLVKLFVSSRNDQDIVLRLQNYPNLEIDSQRNSDDIAQFVKDETERLIQDGELLQYSTSQAEMKELVISKVINGAAGMFRWASLQLQYLCSFDLDADIKKSLGNLPPDLHALYDEIYDMLSKKPGEHQATIFKNVLHWLLCARKTLKTEYFLCAVSINSHIGDDVSSISKDFILKTCNNLVVFDSQLDTFRFAHLSVREFLEQRAEYSITETNSLVAEACLWTVLTTSPNLATKKLLSQLGWHMNTAAAGSETLVQYADIYWPEHCKSAGYKRNSGRLKMALRHFLFGDPEATSSIKLWNDRLYNYRSWLQLMLSGFTDRKVLDQLEDVLVTANSIFAGVFPSCAFDFEEQIENITGKDILARECVNIQGRSPLLVAARSGSCGILARLLDQDKYNTDIMVDVAEAAAGSKSSGEEVMALILDRRGSDVLITEEVVKAAAGNWYSGEGVMRLLLDRREADVPITEEVVKSAAGNNSEGVMALLLDQRGSDVLITEEVVKAAAGNSSNGKEMMTLLLKRRGSDVPITEEVVKMAARNGRSGKEVMALLLDKRGSDVPITEEVVKAAAGNWYNGEGVMTLLLDRREADIPITEEVVKSAAANSSEGVMALLLDRRGSEVPVTEEVVKYAAWNLDSSKEVMALLLDQRGSDVPITEEVVKMAAGNSSSGKKVMALLLDQRGSDVPITEEVVKAAAENGRSGKEVMAVLLDRRGSDVPITEEVVKAAAENSSSGKEVMTLLLDRLGSDVPITEEVVKAAAGNSSSSKEVMALLLDQRGSDVPITEEVVKVAAENSSSGKEVMTLLLDRRGSDVLITEEVVKMAAGNGYSGKEVMILLLDQQGSDVPVTEEVVKMAARNGDSGKEVIALLLDRRGSDVPITEEVVKAAARSWRGKEVMALLLDRRGSDIPITEEVVKAAAGNSSGGKEVMALLLDQRGSDIPITEEVVKAAAGNSSSGKEVMALLLDQRGSDVLITEEVAKAASGNRHGEEMMALLLERRGSDIPITEEVAKAVTRNGGQHIVGNADLSLG